MFTLKAAQERIKLQQDNGVGTKKGTRQETYKIQTTFKSITDSQMKTHLTQREERLYTIRKAKEEHAASQAME